MEKFSRVKTEYSKYTNFDSVSFGRLSQYDIENGTGLMFVCLCICVSRSSVLKLFIFCVLVVMSNSVYFE